MKLRIAGSVVLATAAFLAVARAAGAPDVERFVVLEREAVLMLKPRLIATGDVAWAQLSDDQRYGVAYRTEAAADGREGEGGVARGRLLLWNASTGQQRVLLTLANPEDAPRFDWLARVPVGLGTLTKRRSGALRPDGTRGEPTTERWLFRLDARSGSLKMLSRIHPEDRLLVSPSQNLAVLARDGGELLHLVRGDGTTAPISVPPGFTPGGRTWSREGTRLTIGFQRGAAREISRWAVLDVPTGRISESAEMSEPYEASWEKSLRLSRRTEILRGRTGEFTISPLWLESLAPSEQSTALLTPHAEWGAFSPNGEGVVYADGNAAWWVELARVPRRDYEEASQRHLHQRAQRLAAALMMYSQDYDDLLPVPEGPVKEVLAPYTRDPQAFQGFTYTHRGNAFTSTEERARTVIGYVQGSAGQLAIYGDGRVRWVPR